MNGDESQTAPTTSSSTTASTTEVSPINLVAVKPAPFYRNNPIVWFKQLEAQFKLSNIKTSSTKYYHTLTSLPEDIAGNLTLSDDESYDNLKAEILRSLKANKHLLIEQALSRIELGDKRPTQLVLDIKRRFTEVGMQVDESIIKSRLLSALPPNIKSALVGHDSLPLDNYAEIADSMLAVAQPVNHYSHIGHIDHEKTYTTQENKQQFQYKKPYTSQENKQYKNSYTVRPFYQGQRPHVCNSHIFFADRARNCRPWCKWPNKDKGTRILNVHEKTPNHSRSSSPVNC